MLFSAMCLNPFLDFTRNPRTKTLSRQTDLNLSSLYLKKPHFVFSEDDSDKKEVKYKQFVQSQPQSHNWIWRVFFAQRKRDTDEQSHCCHHNHFQMSHNMDPKRWMEEKISQPWWLDIHYSAELRDLWRQFKKKQQSIENKYLFINRNHGKMFNYFCIFYALNLLDSWRVTGNGGNDMQERANHVEANHVHLQWGPWPLYTGRPL